MRINTPVAGWTTMGQSDIPPCSGQIRITAEACRQPKRPARVDPIYTILRSRRRGCLGSKDDANLRAQAKRVAWRQLLRWVQAQIAMIQTGMVDAGEVFAPFLLQAESGQTLWQHLTATRFKELPAPEQERR